MFDNPSELRGDASLLANEIRSTDDDWQESYNEAQARKEIEELLERGPLEPLDQTNLMAACGGRGFVDTVRWLLDKGWEPWIDASGIDQEGNDDRVGAVCTSVFHEAAGANQTDLLDLLWERGFRFTQSDGNLHWVDGNTPLEWAAYFGAKEGMSWLLAHDHPVNAQGAEGWTALMSLLINAKDPDVQDKLVACAHVLLEHGADVSIKKHDGYSIPDMIEHEGMEGTPLGQVLMAAINRLRLGQVAQAQGQRKPGGPGRM